MQGEYFDEAFDRCMQVEAAFANHPLRAVVVEQDLHREVVEERIRSAESEIFCRGKQKQLDALVQDRLGLRSRNEQLTEEHADLQRRIGQMTTDDSDLQKLADQ